VKQGPVRVVTPKLIAVAHRAGVEVHVWTINDQSEMRELVALGVDGIITDRADLAIEALGLR
jgi:glycerophosphoryl diester phosphodiesterase